MILKYIVMIGRRLNTSFTVTSMEMINRSNMD